MSYRFISMRIVVLLVLLLSPIILLPAAVHGGEYIPNHDAERGDASGWYGDMTVESGCNSHDGDYYFVLTNGYAKSRTFTIPENAVYFTFNWAIEQENFESGYYYLKTEDGTVLFEQSAGYQPNYCYNFLRWAPPQWDITPYRGTRVYFYAYASGATTIMFDDVRMTDSSGRSIDTFPVITDALSTVEQYILDTGQTPRRGGRRPVDHLDKGRRSLERALASFNDGDYEMTLLRLGKAVRELSNACSPPDIYTGDIIRLIIESPNYDTCTSDGDTSSDAITRQLLQGAILDIQDLIASPEADNWQPGAVRILEIASGLSRRALDLMDNGELDESLVWLARTVRFLQNASSLGAPTTSIIDGIAYIPLRE